MKRFDKTGPVTIMSRVKIQNGEISHDTDFQDRRRCNTRKEEMQPGCWIALTNPTASEILEIADACQIDPDHLKAPLDEEERSRIEAEDEYTLILVDIPSIEERNGKTGL